MNSKSKLFSSKYYPWFLLAVTLLTMFYLISDLISIKKGEVKGSTTLSINLSKDLPSIPFINQKTTDPFIYSRIFALYDQESGSFLTAKNIDKKIPIASITKVMTAVIISENHKLDEIVKVPKLATQAIGSVINLRVGEEITINSLLHGLLINSGNDSAYSLAIYHAKSVNPGFNDEQAFDYFIEIMNTKAISLGLQNSTYKNPAGLDDSASSTARDQAILIGYALKNEIISGIAKKPSAKISSADGKITHQLDNSDRLVKEEMYYPGIIGGKTGFTPTSGHSLVTGANRNGHILIAIIINTYANTTSASAIEAKKLLDWGYNNFTWVKL